jgi:hypothetical protein
MPGIILPQRWATQPQHPVDIDWANPITRDLRFAWNGALQWDAVRGVLAATRATPNVSAFGVGCQVTVAGCSVPHSGATNKPKSVIAVSNLTNFNGGGNIFLRHGPSGGWGFWVDNSGYRWTHYGVADYTIGASPPGDFQVRVHGATAVPGGAVTAYTSGRVAGSTSIGSMSASSAANAVVNLGPSGASAVGHTALAAYWDRALTAEEHWSLSEDPWQIFRPRRQRVFLPTAGGGSSTIDCVVGNTVANGVAATINQAISLSCTVGNAAAAGSAATISQAINVACVVGDASAAGTAATINAATNLACAVGNAAAAGVAAGVELGGSISIDCTAGNAGAAGVVAVVNGAISIACAVGGAVAAGAAATITIGAQVVCAVGDAAAAGVAATVQLTTNLACAVGDAVAAGVACGINLSGGLVVNPRFLVISKARSRSVIAPARNLSVVMR